MKNVTLLPDSALRFQADDAFRAIQANPDNPKVPQYFEERFACFRELERRARVRAWRETSRFGIDPLTEPLTVRPRIHGLSDYYRTARRTAQFTLGWHSVHGWN